MQLPFRSDGIDALVKDEIVFIDSMCQLLADLGNTLPLLGIYHVAFPSYALARRTLEGRGVILNIHGMSYAVRFSCALSKTI